MKPYLLRSHLMIVSGLVESQTPPDGGVVGGVVGGGVEAAAGVTKLCVSDQALAAFGSYARTRQ